MLFGAGMDQNCTKTELHEDIFARGHKIAQGDKISRKHFCTRVKNNKNKIKQKKK